MANVLADEGKSENFNAAAKYLSFFARKQIPLSLCTLNASFAAAINPILERVERSGDILAATFATLASISFHLI